MQSVHFDATVYQNASWTLKGTFKDAAGNPVDLSSYAGEFAVRSDVTSPDAIFRGDSISGHVVLTAGPIDNVVLKMTATETDALPTSNQEVTDWTYEFIMWDTGDAENTTIRLIEGHFVVSPSVARADEGA